jgi:hypothetical protein
MGYIYRYQSIEFNRTAFKHGYSEVRRQTRDELTDGFDKEKLDMEEFAFPAEAAIDAA